MPESWVLMTAMPPTKGHLSLIQFANEVTPGASYLTEHVNVIVCTQPGEPFPVERWQAINEAVEASPALRDNVRVYRHHETLPQEPEDENDVQFWVMWNNILKDYGFLPGDYIISSESYGLDLAEATGGVFMPFDMERIMTPSKASLVREGPHTYQDYILPEFIPYVRRTVTIFGAESVGKTTASIMAGASMRATILPEWARPYLEAVGPEITVERMQRIYQGQRALQDTAQQNSESLYIVQDTDLFSTVGYWEMWNKDSMPNDLLEDARNRKSDLYIILSSDLTFEPDPLRFGGDKRETSDQYWIDLCERENLSYVYITETNQRYLAVYDAIQEFFRNINPLSYQRVGSEYEKSV